MTPEPHSPTDTDDTRLGPPPGCPAHGTGPGGLRRLYGPEAEDLGAVYEKLRAEHGAVAPALLHQDVPIWVVLGHGENLHMVSSPSQFCKDSRLWTSMRDGTVEPDHPLMPYFAWQPICAHAEGDEHLRLRGAVTGAMSTIDHRGIRRHINRATQHLVNQFCEDGNADLVAEFAEHLPMAVICEILGMPEEYGDRLVQAARDCLKGTETAIASHAYLMATALLLEFTADAGAVRIVACGHPSPVLLRAGRVTEIDVEAWTPLGLGLSDAGPLSGVSVRLRSGDRLFLASDGVWEARDTGGSFYPLVERLSQLADHEAPLMTELVWADMLRHSPEIRDDVTMLVLTPGARPFNS
ncbi:SpoIIE family protein phosphatase [Streptomyces prunicolor]|uniref:SpoIIE family protein phosphatase n=1 Tax=Streptomyces prunicolor TaxID=67348 RepID=UPI0033CECAC3